MAKSIKLGADTYIDGTAIQVFSGNASFRKTLDDGLGIINSGEVATTDTSLANYGNLCRDRVYATRRLHTLRITAAGAPTGGYFAKSTVYALYAFDNPSYGWAVLYTDHPNIVAFGSYATGTWTWKAPTLTTVS